MLKMMPGPTTVTQADVQQKLEEFFLAKVADALKQYKDEHDGKPPTLKHLQDVLASLTLDDFRSWAGKSGGVGASDVGSYADMARRTEPGQQAGYFSFFGIPDGDRGRAQSPFERARAGLRGLVELTAFGGLNGHEKIISETPDAKSSGELVGLVKLLRDWKPLGAGEAATMAKERAILSYISTHPMSAHMLLAAGRLKRGELATRASTADQLAPNQSREFISTLYDAIALADDFARASSGTLGADKAGRYIPGFEFSPYTRSTDFKEPIPDATSNKSLLQHYQDAQREYASDWVPDPTSILRQGLLTLANDIIALGYKNNDSEDMIRKMLSFLPAGAVVDEPDPHNPGGTRLGIDAAKLTPLANQIKSAYGLRSADDYYKVVLRDPATLDYLRNLQGSQGPLFPELAGAKAIPQSWIANHEERLSGLGAKMTAWLNHTLALSTMRLIQQFVIVPVFERVAGLDGYKRAGPNPIHFDDDAGRFEDSGLSHLHAVLAGSGTKEFAAGSASHEPPLDPSLVASNWYNEMMAANKSFDTNKAYFGYSNSDPLNLDSDPKYAPLAQYVGEPTVYLALIYPSDGLAADRTMTRLMRAILEEDQKRGRTGPFHDQVEALRGLLTYDASTESYTLPDSNRMAYYRWVQSRKPDKDTESPDHPATWYLNRKDVRFTGTGSDVPTQVAAHADQSVSKEARGRDEKVPVSFSTESISGDGHERTDLIVPGQPLRPQTDPSAPFWNLKVAVYAPYNPDARGRLVEKVAGFEHINTSGDFSLDMSKWPDSPFGSHEILGLGKTPKAIAEVDNPRIDVTFRFDLDLSRVDRYYVYSQFTMEKQDGTFRISAGEDLPEFITDEMQAHNAGTHIDRLTPAPYRLDISRVRPAVPDFERVDFGSVEVNSLGGTIRFRSTKDIVRNVPIFDSEGKPALGDPRPLMDASGRPILEASGEPKMGPAVPLVKSEAIVMPQPGLVGESGSRGIFTVKLGDIKLPADSKWRNLVDRVADPSQPTGYRYELLDELPASNIPVGVMGVGIRGSPQVDMRTGEVEGQEFFLIAKDKRHLALKLEDMDKPITLKSGAHEVHKRLTLVDDNGQTRTVALVTYRTRIEGKKEVMEDPKVALDRKFVRDVMAGGATLKDDDPQKASKMTALQAIKDRFAVPAKLDPDGALPETELPWSGKAYIGVSVDAQEWDKLEREGTLLLSRIVPWSATVQTPLQGKELADEIAQRKELDMDTNPDIIPGHLVNAVALEQREAEGSTPNNPKLILSYRIPDGEDKGKLLDVYRASKKGDTWQCEPIIEFDADGKPKGDYKRFLQELQLLPAPELDEGKPGDGSHGSLLDGEGRGWSPDWVPRRMRG